MAIASDDNPWSMDEPADQQQPYFDLSTGGAGGSFARDQKSDHGPQSRFLGKSDRANETIIPKSYPLGGSAAAGQGAQKSDKEQYFGYAGPQPKIGQGHFGPTDSSQFGAFPPARSGGYNKKRSAGTGGSGKGVQFGGKSYGAFPPKEAAPVDAIQQQWQAFLKSRANSQRNKSSAFANVAPPPIPEPVPQSSYSYRGYGTRIAPGYGASGYGLGGYGPGGLGAGYGPMLGNPGMPGPTMPGFMW